MELGDVIVLTEAEIETIEGYDERIQNAKHMMETGAEMSLATNKAMWEYLYGCHPDLTDYILVLRRPTHELVVTRVKKK